MEAINLKIDKSEITFIELINNNGNATSRERYKQKFKIINVCEVK
ncbi:hypothetical protein GCM10010832_26300 [Psychroflexus planctonicus]|uniref:Uncharacterized protein n=1 Tax=Psychroflexus planctonicus TaxID=1526575 RepID=A0ABQ1SNV6_9FLAO|nr:hypothetical protein GCM10010832_26300 [Psychroflexus planctonicus]